MRESGRENAGSSRKGEPFFAGERVLSCGSLYALAFRVGEDLSVLLYGGERPHLGCTVLSVPRPSLTGDGSISSTSSVLNVVGHKDEAICRAFAERLCAGSGRTVVCSGGFHSDALRPEDIREVTDAAASLAEELLGKLRETPA